MNSQKKDILYSALLSYQWLFICKDEKFPLRKDLEKFETFKGGPIINAGVLISFAYMVLVFARESKLYNKFLIDNLNINDFQIELDELNSSTQTLDFIRRIRNSLAHANLLIDKTYIIFQDGKPNTKINFRVRILTSDFGNFMNNVLHNWNNFEKLLKLNNNEN
ncbi:MAG: HEPN family nuclease [Thermonemataceae bacterium]|nr:HEPN family nuclease [Thermonemataceae bacterium]